MQEPVFLTLAEIFEIHNNQIELYGGEPGLRELGLLQSAIAQPEATFGAEWLHKDLFSMAAAYAFHISQNQPFVDGNKRTGLASALVFLEMNGIGLDAPGQKLLEGMLRLANGKINKDDFARILHSLA